MFTKQNLPRGLDEYQKPGPYFALPLGKAKGGVAANCYQRATHRFFQTSAIQAASNTGLVIRFKGIRQFAGNISQKHISSETQREAISSDERWAIGVIDGHGHVSMECSNAVLKKWVPCLKVTLHACNARAIYRLKRVLGVGSVTRSGDYINLRVRNLAGWKKLLILFDKFPLRTDKYYAIEMVKKGLELKRLVQEKKVFLTYFFPGSNACWAARLGQAKDREVVHQCLLNWKLRLKSDCGKPSPVWFSLLPLLKAKGTLDNIDLIAAFDNCEQALLEQILDLDWLAGFAEAEASFYILENGRHGFAIGQAYNQLVVAGIRKRLGIKTRLKIRTLQPGLCPYVQSETKDMATLLKIAGLLKGKMLGIKSFTFSVWLRTLRKNNRLKSQKRDEDLNYI